MPSPSPSPSLRAAPTTMDIPTSTTMTPQSSQSSQYSLTRRAKPNNVQTSFIPSISTSTPSVSASAISASSVTTSSSPQASPIMSPETAQLATNNSSIQGSPDGLRGRDSDFPLPPFELPESIVSRKSSQSAMSEAMTMSKSPGLIRRISNRATQFAGRRRQSSTTAMSRDHSTGPVIVRRRSDSTNTAPEGGRGALLSDSEPELVGDYREELHYPLGVDGPRDFPSTTASIGSSTVPTLSSSPGPVIPAILTQGTMMQKVTKKKNKALVFVLDSESAKVSWGRDKPSKCFYIDDIKDIRVGADARNYRQEFRVSAADEPRFFSIVYAIPDKSKGRAQKVMHLIATDEQTFYLWTTTLDAISKHRQDLMASLSSFHDKAVRACWRTEMSKQYHDKPHSDDEEEIDIVGVERLCRSLHIHGSSNYIRSKFDEADVSRTGRLNFAEFQDFVKLMKRRDDVGAIYRELASDSEKGITAPEFFGFLKTVQREDVDADRVYWEGTFARFARRSKSKEQALQDTIEGTPRMNEAALTSFLISTFNVPLEAFPTQFTPTLDRPLNEYYISSSHNTYLLGRQVAGQSSVEAYISALNRGCRCVEVDCWNGSDGQPVVMHGRTLTSQVSFHDVMSTISKYAFVKSPYPLWISLEVHCNPAQQALMAEIIRSTCGLKLVTEPLDASYEQLPSPSQLLNRILIKVKKPRLFQDSSLAELPTGRSRGSSVNSPYIRPAQLDNSTISAGLLPPSPYQRAPRLVRAQFKNSGSEGPDSLSSSTSDSESFTEDMVKAKESNRRNKTSNIIKVLGELGVYSAGLKFHGFDTAESKACNHIFSFMESTFDKNSRTPEDRRAITRHNMRYMMRVYPNGWRVASTNFDPLKYWRRGVQMVALNWQTYDLGMQMNDAMFAGGTDQSGYILKPRELREITMIPSVLNEAGAGHIKRERKNVNFSIDVISAQQLMRPKGLAQTRSVDPYIEVEVFHADDKDKDNKGVVGEGGSEARSKDGSSGLGTPHKRRTGILQENGFNPIFNNKFTFDLTTKFPELVFVRWTVRCSPDGHSFSDKGLPLATYTAKLSSLKQGYRTLPLYDGNGDQFLFSTLFCRIKIDPATSIYVNGPEAPEREGVFKTIRQTVFNRTPMSPKPLLDTGHQ
ncbi:1-phosphatidylinositol 4,5-bisphosphate phosphodiesterase 1 [Lachnellula cervina]|uniref:Phosphoinositide phospholipase C n=1 Tax=Lachnellula cervina TaxID=1316786 RepID=A0A7D8URD2_9HELO|nr:1-phosphatidylinositol 4,5-bisphosphate phosphodiesterase 1 [Lachnellula cervina]